MAGKAKRRYGFEPDYAVPPGATLQETIDSLGITQKELGVRTGLSSKTINLIVKGDEPISHKTAVALERVTGVPARMWNNLESNYREQLARLADRDRLERDAKWLNTIPAKELVKRGVIENSKDKATLLDSVLRFFGVSSVGQWNELWMKPDAAFRKSERFRSEPGAVATWLRLGEVAAHDLDVAPYDRARFIQVLGDVRSLTTQAPEEFQPEMVRLCASAGVAVVFVREIPECRVSGVSRWLSSSKALIQLSLRYKWEDQIWFSFFHEAGHILNDPRKGVYIDDGDSGDRECEERANRFAANFLIPERYRSRLSALTTGQGIREFAEEIDISPGIVLGRVQKEKILPWRTHLNKLKRRFEWSTESRAAKE